MDTLFIIARTRTAIVKSQSIEKKNFMNLPLHYNEPMKVNREKVYKHNRVNKQILQFQSVTSSIHYQNMYVLYIHI